MKKNDKKKKKKKKKKTKTTKKKNYRAVVGPELSVWNSTRTIFGCSRKVTADDKLEEGSGPSLKRMY